MPLRHQDSRINFGIDYYDNEAEAEAAAQSLANLGVTKWGQHFGRDKGFDLSADAPRPYNCVTEGPLYAVVVP